MTERPGRVASRRDVPWAEVVATAGCASLLLGFASGWLIRAGLLIGAIRGAYVVGREIGAVQRRPTPAVEPPSPSDFGVNW